MNKRTILLAVIVLVLGTVQLNAEVTFGLKGRLNLATFVGKDAGGSYELLPMIHIGGVLEKRFSKKNL